MHCHQIVESLFIVKPVIFSRCMILFILVTMCYPGAFYKEYHEQTRQMKHRRTWWQNQPRSWIIRLRNIFVPVMFDNFINEVDIMIFGRPHLVYMFLFYWDLCLWLVIFIWCLLIRRLLYFWNPGFLTFWYRCGTFWIGSRRTLAITSCWFCEIVIILYSDTVVWCRHLNNFFQFQKIIII